MQPRKRIQRGKKKERKSNKRVMRMRKRKRKRKMFKLNRSNQSPNLKSYSSNSRY
jgi:hypothetical protein